MLLAFVGKNSEDKKSSAPASQASHSPTGNKPADPGEVDRLTKEVETQVRQTF